ncbi:hypothetical protein [Shewanella colwelliana]|uniref:hypothetical protein n=1 Tax=Shewanella colwelliana TaxID=23 RepID=UPI00299D4B8B|nr:hypothetical protein [Shewanella colwelliana]MDX1280460.1 hypothetical protein [Shewanella colwelliana]
MWWRILTIFLAFALLGAHFLRYGQPLLCALFVVAPILLIFRHRFVAHFLQMVLLLSAVFVWGLSGYDYVQIRIAMDAPWLRLSLIMSAVTMFTICASICCHGVQKRRAQQN